MALKSSHRRENKFVSTSGGLSAADSKQIDLLFVKTGKIGGHQRSREKSTVWAYFGELCYRNDSNNPSPSASSSSESQTLDDSRHFCSVCLSKVQSQPAAQRHISQVQSYSKTTSTGTLADHLSIVHDIKLTTNSAVDGKRQCTMEDMINSKKSSFCPASNQEELNRDFAVWLALDLEPFSMVNNEGMRYFFGKNFPKVHIPDESTLRKKKVYEVYNDLAEEVRRELASVSTLNLMFDGWTDKHHAIHYLGLRVQFICQDWVGRVVTLSVKPCAGDADSLSEHILGEIQHFIPEYRKKKLYSTHDGASAMTKTSKLLKVQNWNHCVAHALHLLLMTDSLKKVSVATAMLDKCKTIVNSLHFKSDVLEREVRNVNDQTAFSDLMDKISHLKALNDAEDLSVLDEGDSSDSENEHHNEANEDHDYHEHSKKKVRRLQNEVSTRWNSTLEMFESLLHMRSEVTNALKSVGKYEKCLKTQEWALLEELAGFLQTFRGLTELVSTKITYLSLIPLIRAEITDACKPSTKDSDELKTVKSLIRRNLDKRLPLSDAVKLATVMDPSTRALTGLTDDAMEDILYNACVGRDSSSTQSSASGSADHVTDVDNTVVVSSSQNTDTSAIPLSKKMKLIQKHVASSQNHPDTRFRLRDEIKAYLRHESDEQDDDPLSFWKKGKFPILQDLAKEVLTQSASSVPVENMFSTMGLVLNGKRSALAPHRANWLSFIHDNFAHYYKTRPEGDSDGNASTNS